MRQPHLRLKKIKENLMTGLSYRNYSINLHRKSINNSLSVYYENTQMLPIEMYKVSNETSSEITIKSSN